MIRNPGLFQTGLNLITLKTDMHLENLSFLSKFNNVLVKTRDKYLLYTLEIELTNRIYKTGILKIRNKIRLTSPMPL